MLTGIVDLRTNRKEEERHCVDDAALEDLCKVGTNGGNSLYMNRESSSQLATAWKIGYKIISSCEMGTIASLSKCS